MKPGLIVILFAAFSASGQTGKQYPSVKARNQFYLDLASTYNSREISDILLSDKDAHFESYIDGHSEEELVKSYSTVVHELLHENNRMEENGHNYFISHKLRISVPFTGYYPSSELNTYVRKGQQDSIFRYGIYVGGKSQIPGRGGKITGVNDSDKNTAMSVSRGIYGLLEEFDAYYYGNLAAFELYGYYLKTYGETNENAWQNYKHDVRSDQLAYYEFSLFIGWYLQFAKEKHPDIYRKIIDNKPLRVAYTLIDNKYRMLVSEIDTKIIEIDRQIPPDFMEVLDFSGSEDDFFHFLELSGLPKEAIYKEVTTTENGKTVVAKKTVMEKQQYDQLKSQYRKIASQLKQKAGNRMTLYFAHPTAPLNYTKKQLTPELKTELDNFRLEGVFEDNYKSFLK